MTTKKTTPPLSTDVRKQLNSLRVLAEMLLRHTKRLGNNRSLTKEMRTQLLDAAEHYANGEYMLTPMPGHRAYVKCAA